MWSFIFFLKVCFLEKLKVKSIPVFFFHYVEFCRPVAN